MPVVAIIPWEHWYSLEDLDVAIKSAGQNRLAARFARGTKRIELLVQALERVGLAWALAMRLDLDRNNTGKAIRAGNQIAIDLLRRASNGPVEGFPMPAIMALIALSVNDAELQAASHDHRKSLEFVDYWRRYVLEALELTLHVGSMNPTSYTGTIREAIQRTAMRDPLRSRALVERAKRVASLLQGGRIARDLHTLRKWATYPRLGDERSQVEPRLSSPEISGKLARTYDELMWWVRELRWFIKAFDRANTPFGLP